MRRARRLSVALALAALAAPAAASGAPCPGAGVCPWVSSASFGRTFTSYFTTITSVSLDSSGDQFLADFYNNRIVELSPSGGFIRAFGKNGGSGASGSGLPVMAM